MHRAGGPCAGHRPVGRVLRRAGPRRRRPDHHRWYAPNRTGWLLPFAAQLLTSAEARRHRRITSPCTTRAARSCCRSCMPGGTPTIRCRSAHRRSRPRSTLPAAQALVARVARTIDDCRTVRCWPARPAMTASRSWAAKAICSISSSRPGPTRAPTLGRHRPTAAGCPWRSSGAPAPRRPDFIIDYRMSMADYVDGGQSWEEIVALAIEVEAAGATLINFGHRLARGQGADHRDLGAPCGVRRHQECGGRRRRYPLVASNRINMPQTAEQILADVRSPGIDGPAIAGRPDWSKAAGAPTTRSTPHRLQSGLPGPRIRAQDRVVSAQSARRPRNHPGARPTAALARWRRRRRTGRTVRGRQRRQNATT